MTNNEFIEQIAEYIKKYASSYGIKVHSPIIAQAILESGWGKSILARKYHNYFGLKSGGGWRGKVVNLQTSEEYVIGVHTQIRDAFRVFDDMESGVKGYFDFIGYSRYANLKGVTDAATACDLIRQDGWATSLAYATNLKRLIQTYNLTAYDEKVTGIASSVVENVAVYQKGNYRVTASALKVRKGPGTKYAQKKFTEMTVSAQSINESRRSTGLAFYLKDIIFTAQEIITVSTKEYWARTPSGYVCLELNGEKYVTKA